MTRTRQQMGTLSVVLCAMVVLDALVQGGLDSGLGATLTLAALAAVVVAHNTAAWVGVAVLGLLLLVDPEDAGLVGTAIFLLLATTTVSRARAAGRRTREAAATPEIAPGLAASTPAPTTSPSRTGDRECVVADPPYQGAVQPVEPAPTIVPSASEGAVETVEQVLADFDRRFIGMTEVREDLEALVAQVAVARRQRANLERRITAGELAPDEVDLPSVIAPHVALLGPPGTGKTSVARTLGRVLRAAGVLPSGHLVEVDRQGLVGSFQGHTAEKVDAAFQRARGGVLFIDEAYGLTDGSGLDTFGEEALGAIVKRTEDMRGELVVALAGYEREMRAWLGHNPGLESRIGRTITLPAASLDELVEIARRNLTRRGIEPASELLNEIAAQLEHWRPRIGERWANAREVRTLLDEAARAHATRVHHAGGGELDWRPEDIKRGASKAFAARSGVPT